MEKITKRKLLLTITLFVAAIILMASFFSISEASNWRLHSTLTQHQLNGIYFLNYNTTIEKKNTINNIALLENDSYINNNKNSNEKQISSLAYAAKFECGVIFEDEGFLSPGYYDTDVSIFNKQGYPTTVLLNVIVNDNINSSANSIIKTIQSQKSTGISCKDITNLFNIRGQEMIEGFMTILVHLDNGIAGSLSSSGAISIIPSLQLSSLSSPDQTNLLDVRVFYSTNSFATTPPQKLVVDKISFSILNDTSGKITHSMLLKTLETTIQSQKNTTFDREAQVKNILAGRYNISNSELTNLKVKVYDVDTTAAAITMVDRHAIFSLQVQPQAIY
jgi:hypothetical protein